MKQLCILLVIAAAACLKGNTLRAQEAAADPAHWSYEAKKNADGNYQLIFHLKLDKGWHIWSVNPGGDGSMIAPSFSFDKNKTLNLTGTVNEQGKMITARMAGVDGALNYYLDAVDYTQQAQVTAKGKITGTLQYQLCNEMVCMPPKDLPFVFEIK